MADEKKPEAPALHIAPEHQSAPKATWADKEVAKAAEEIASGQFQPDMSDAEFFDYGETQFLAQHPRVIEALARLEREKDEAKNSQESIEKTQMLFEMNARASQRNQWDGQGRWIGQENEEMRIGLILTPFQFMERLEKVIGENKVRLNRFAVKGRVALLVEDKTPKSAILLPGHPKPNTDGWEQVATLQFPCSTEFMVMRFDEYGVPTTAKYLGWRTALLSMIQLGIITEKEAHKAFPLGSGPAADWYRQQLFRIRAERGTVN